MKLRRCFINESGNVWRDATLHHAATGLPEEIFDPDSISLDEMIRWKIVNLRDYVNHFNRVAGADLSEPIILRSDGYPMDGWHRIIKAIAMGGVTLLAKRFIRDPPPDFSPNG